MRIRRKALRSASRDHGGAVVREITGVSLRDTSGNPEMPGDRRGSVVDRRTRFADRRQRSVDRRGIFTDRRGATEVRYRAPPDTQMQAQLTAWQERERRRIAADLHDSIGSSLCTIRLKLQEAIGQLQQDASQAAPLKTIVSDVVRTMDELRRIAMDLRPSILDDLGIVATISWLSRELEGSQKGLRVERQIDVREQDIPGPLKTPIFRILQESFNNTLKHGGARLVRVSLRQDGAELRLTIEDDGAGFEMTKVLQNQDFSQHVGIANMRQRANSSGGMLTIRSTPGAGVMVSCAWPNSPG